MNELSYWKWPPNATASPSDFGHNTMLFARVAPSTASLNMLLVLATYLDTSFLPGQTPEFYKEKYFGETSSLEDYFNANSSDIDIQVNLAGILGLRHPKTLACAHRWNRCSENDGRRYEQNFVELLENIPPTESRRIAEYDTNKDGQIMPDELFVIFLLGLPDRAQNTDPLITDEEDPNPFDDNGGLNRPLPECASLSGTVVQICGIVLPIADETNFITTAHEVSHLFGAYDIYGAGNNFRYSVMAGTISDTEFYVHLDPWHKMRMGFEKSSIFAIQKHQPSPSRLYLTGLGTPLGSRSAIFYDPERGKNEYFIVELRDSETPFDEDVQGQGLVVWYVNTNENFVPRRLDMLPELEDDLVGLAVAVVGAPDYRLGRGRAWQIDEQVNQLMWSDGTESRLRFYLGEDDLGSFLEWWSE